MKNLTIFGLLISSLVIANPAIADETYFCTYGQDERVLSVVYQDQDKKVPCEVRYQKDGVTETLWDAKSEVGFCEEKAQAFVEKLRGWGWQCSASESGS